MFGCHVERVHSTNPGRPSIVEHIRAARRTACAAGFDARVFQIFVANPRNSTITMRPEENVELQDYLRNNPRLAVFAHGSFLDFPWNGGPRLIRSIREELKVCARAGVSGLVIHLGKPSDEDVLAHLPQLIKGKNKGVRIYLETPSLKPEVSRHETPTKLAALFRKIDALGPGFSSKFGLCIDTAHLWACGVDLSTYEAAEAWLSQLEAAADTIPPDRIIIHLNDNRHEKSSGLDHHAAPLEGKIWGEFKGRPRQSGLAAFVDYAVKHNTPTIFERKPPEELLNDYAAVAQLTTVVRIDD